MGTVLAAATVGATSLRVRVEEPVPVAPLVVRTTAIDRAGGYEIQLEFVGRVESARVAEPGFELPGLVKRVWVEEGDDVAEGELLAELDTARLEAERAVLVASRDESVAQRRLAERTDRRFREALALDAVSDQDADESRQALAVRRASTERIDAQIRRIDVDLAKSKLVAPFAGRIARRWLDGGNVVQEGHAVVRLLETYRLEVRAGLSPEAARHVAPGDALPVRIAGRTHRAIARSVLPERSRETRSVALILALEPGTEGARDGDLAEVSISQWRAAEGSWVPVSALAEGSRGLWSVYVAKVDDGEHRVERRPVELLHQDGERAFVRGTIGAGDLVVTNGTHRLVSEQRVRLESTDHALAGLPIEKEGVR